MNQRTRLIYTVITIFISFIFPTYGRWNRFLKNKEVKIFRGEDYIITIGKSHWVVSILFNSAKENTDPYEIMKVLTMISSALLLLTFIASLYGMNVRLPFQNHPFSFWFVMIYMVTIAGGMILHLKRRKWM